jgi:hypothetical protein
MPSILCIINNFEQYLFLWNGVILHSLIVAQQVTIYSTSYKTRSSITVFPRAYKWTPSWTNLIKLTTVYPVLMYVFISFHLYLCLSIAICLSDFASKLFMHFSCPHACAPLKILDCRCFDVYFATLYHEYKKVKLSQALRHEGVWGSEYIDQHFLHLGTSWRWVVSFTSLPLYPRGKSPRYPLDRRLEGLQNRSGRRAEEKILNPIGTRIPPICRPAQSQSLYWVRYLGSLCQGYIASKIRMIDKLVAVWSR